MTRSLTDDEITRQLLDLPGWRRDGDEISATYAAGLTQLDIELAHRIAQHAKTLGASNE